MPQIIEEIAELRLSLINQHSIVEISKQFFVKFSMQQIFTHVSQQVTQLLTFIVDVLPYEKRMSVTQQRAEVDTEFTYHGW